MNAKSRRLALAILVVMALLLLASFAQAQGCGYAAMVRGWVQCGHDKDVLRATPAGCSQAQWTLNSGGYFGYQIMYGNSPSDTITFYLNGNPIGSATITFAAQSPYYQNVSFNICQQPTTTTTRTTTTQGSCISYNITGSVADCDTPSLHLPIAGATVYVLGHPEIPAKTTDASGCFDLGAVPAGTYTVMAVSGAKSGYTDITLPDVIPPCGDCYQIFICANSTGPCPNAGTTNMCCDWLATHNPTLYQLYCAPTTTTTGTTTTGTTETGITTGTTDTGTTTVTTTGPTCVYDPAWLAGCPNTMVWLVGPGGALQVPASDIQAYVPPSLTLWLLILVVAIILAAVAFWAGGRGGGKAEGKR